MLRKIAIYAGNSRILLVGMLLASPALIGCSGGSSFGPSPFDPPPEPGEAQRLIGEWEGSWAIPGAGKVPVKVELKADKKARIFAKAPAISFQKDMDDRGSWKLDRVDDDGALFVQFENELAPGEWETWKITFDGDDRITLEALDAPPMKLQRKK